MHTWPSVSAPLARAAEPTSPHLFLVIAAHHPLLPPARHVLADVDIITIRRSAERTMERGAQGGRHHLTLGVPDPWMSDIHARLVKIFSRWEIRDAGSRNGTYRNGVPIEHAVLEDGDVLELGHTFFIFRTAMPADPMDPLDFLAPPHASSLPGMSTLLPQLGRAFAALRTVAVSPISVVILGDSGTGKELIARAVHTLSQRTGPLVGVNCGALPETLITSELFGCRKGAYTGASERLGHLRSADKGTLLLDEIGDLPLGCQTAFLRVLQERQVVPVGGTRPISVDIRLCAATHRDLAQQVATGSLRGDLLARISGFTLRLPPLRERREDLGILVGALLQRIAPDRVGRVGRIELGRDAIRALLHHTWPLNIRELEKCLEHAVVLAGEQTIRVEHLPEMPQPTGAAAGIPAPAHEPERGDRSPAHEPDRGEPLIAKAGPYRCNELKDLVKEHKGNISRIAQLLGKHRAQIRIWLRRCGIDPQDFRTP
jgi:DNA-binding NtrC family response regulator